MTPRLLLPLQRLLQPLGSGPPAGRAGAGERRAYIPDVTTPIFEKRPPLTVIAFVAVVAAVLVDLLLSGRIDGWLFGGGLLLLLASYGLVRGIWFAWVFLTVVAAGDLVIAAVRWPAWEGALVNATLLALLVRAHCAMFGDLFFSLAGAGGTDA